MLVRHDYRMLMLTEIGSGTQSDAVVWLQILLKLVFVSAAVLSELACTYINGLCCLSAAMTVVWNVDECCVFCDISLCCLQSEGWLHCELFFSIECCWPFCHVLVLICCCGVNKSSLFVQGTMRVLLVLLHDFPEFLCDYHYAFCDVIPPNCIQVRNLVLSAFPRNMRLPDPFTPNLKVDMLPEITHPPRVMSNFVSFIQPQSFKKVFYLLHLSIINY